MTPTYAADDESIQEVLVALGGEGSSAVWFADVERRVGRVGLVLSRSFANRAALRRIEQGTLAAAVVVGGHGDPDGLSALRLIRSVDSVLLCWLVAGEVSPRMLRAALELGVSSVLSEPIGAGELADALTHRLVGADRSPGWRGTGGIGRR